MVGALFEGMSCRKRKVAGLLLVLFTLFLYTIGSSLGGGSPTVAPPPQSVEKITSVPITDGTFYSLTHLLTYSLIH